MRIAQRLYENGYITYMRTDSTTLSETAINAARAQARELYGDAVRPRRRRGSTPARSRTPRRRTRRSGRPGRRSAPRAQVARERRRRRVPALRADLAAHRRLADGRRARHHVSVRIAGTAGPARSACSPRPAGRSPFPGFLQGLRRDRRRPRPAARPTTPSAGCRTLTAGPAADRRELTPAGHTTNPPARYTEASLVKALEELGIGRPSTYASIIRTIQDRGYVWKKGQRAGPVLDRVRGDRAARAALRPAGRLRLHRRDGGRARRDRRRARTRRTDWLTAFYFGGDAGPRGLGRRAPAG